MAEIKIQNLGFGDPLGIPPPKGESVSETGPTCAIMQNFGVIVAEISVTGHIQQI